MSLTTASTDPRNHPQHAQRSNQLPKTDNPKTRTEHGLMGLELLDFAFQPCVFIHQILDHVLGTCATQAEQEDTKKTNTDNTKKPER